jgi:hypothetical protein
MNTCDAAGRSILSVVAERGQRSLCRVLLTARAAVDSADLHQRSPLHHAIVQNHCKSRDCPSSAVHHSIPFFSLHRCCITPLCKTTVSRMIAALLPFFSFHPISFRSIPFHSIHLRHIPDPTLTHTFISFHFISFHFISLHSMFSDPIVRMLLEAGANTYCLEMPQLRPPLL